MINLTLTEAQLSNMLQLLLLGSKAPTTDQNGIVASAELFLLINQQVQAQQPKGGDKDKDEGAAGPKGTGGGPAKAPLKGAGAKSPT